jgi:hypothetical protein
VARWVCSSCGAPLTAPKCPFCGTVTSSAPPPAAGTSRDLEILQVQNELARLDREFPAGARLAADDDDDVAPTAASAAGAKLIMFAVPVFGVVWTISAASMGAPAIFPLFGVFFVLFGVLAARKAWTATDQTAARLAIYRARREELLERLERLQAGTDAD